MPVGCAYEAQCRLEGRREYQWSACAVHYRWEGACGAE
jgi:hypothetical protein